MPTASAQAFSLTDTRGQHHTLAGHQGKWVLINLWATWCAPCLIEMPELEALSKARDDLVVIGLAIDGPDPERITRFTRKLQITYPVVAGTPALAQQFGFTPRGYPTSILYDRHGNQRLIKEGRVSRHALEDFMNLRKAE